jgi:uncharacterized membrane protein YphA (DoxX/SURF4 family)
MIVGLIFIYASVEKILYPAYFAVSIQNYQLIPDYFTNIVAVLLPWLELYCGLSILIGLWHQAGAAIVSLLNIVFIIALTSAVFRGLDIDCGCYGTGSSANVSRIIEDLFLLAFSLQITLFPQSKFALESLFKRLSD